MEGRVQETEMRENGKRRGRMRVERGWREYRKNRGLGK